MLDKEFEILEDAIDDAHSMAYSEYNYGDESEAQINKLRTERLEALEKIKRKLNE